MARFAVFGFPGETQLWLADLEMGSIAPLEMPDGGTLAFANELRAKGTTFTKGVDFAVSIDTGETIAGSFFNP
jgi:hypothetical protein